MSFLYKIILVSFVLLCLVACSNDDGSSADIIRRFDENGKVFSPTELGGESQFLTTMRPEKVRFVSLDQNLDAIDSFEVSMDSSWDGNKLSPSFRFHAKLREYQWPYLKMVTVFPSDVKKQKMEFAQYVRLTDENSYLKPNLYSALAAGRIETLVKNHEMNFDKAQEQALMELGRVFGQDLSNIDKETFSAWGENVKGGTRLKGMLPYVYCRHEISDTLFYSDFKELRETFAKTGRIGASVMVRAADAYLSTFERSFEAEFEAYFCSMSRDTMMGLHNMDYTFFEEAYGINFPWPSGSNDTIQIKDKSSAYYKRHFVMDNIWRLKSLLEEEVGLCSYHFLKDSLIYYKGDYYRCEIYSNIWHKETDRKVIQDHLFGECRQSDMGKMFYVGDSLYTCVCEGLVPCSWSDKYTDKKFDEDDPLYATVLDAKVAARFGRCTDGRTGDMLEVDGVYVECYDYKWTPIKALLYHLGRCNNVNKKGEYNGTYYSCANYWSGLSDTMWQEIYPPEYYNDDCSLNRVVKYDDSYYICESNECKASDGFPESGCFALRNWRKLEDAELIPPILNMDACERSKVNRKVVYDDVFYECSAGTWHVVDKGTLLPPEKDGQVCNDSLFGAVRRYGGDYYTCDSNYQWSVMGVLSSAPYMFKDSLGRCDTISEKTLHWYGSALGFYGCAKDSGSVAWRRIELGPHPNTMPLNYDKKSFAGGIIENDSLYKVTVDGKLYLFNIYDDNWTLTHVEISGKTYDAYFYRGRLFLHGERGVQRVRLDSIENKSESFDTFYADWKAWAKECSLCQGRRADVDSSVSSLRFYEGAYMDWEYASKFCPEGFHVPSLEEFAQQDYLAYMTTDMDVRNDSPIIWDYTMHRSGCVSGNTMYFDIFWTSTENDAESQHCVEIAWHPYNGEKGWRVAECPKDLYPMVQTICVEDD